MYAQLLKQEYFPIANTIRLSGPCVVTKKPYSVTVHSFELRNYLNGTLAQDAFPNLSNEDREFLISGTSPEGWTILFGEDNA